MSSSADGTYIDGVYIQHPDSEENPFGDEDEQTEEIKRLRELLENRLQQSKRRLNGVSRKADQLHRQARNKGSADRMRAVVSDSVKPKKP